MACDRESFLLLLNVLQQSGYRISAEQSLLSSLLPAWEKAMWRPSARRISGKFSRGEFKLGANDVVHDGMHALIVSRYSEVLVGRPEYTLLTEALASAANVYFDLECISRFPKSKLAVRLIQQYLELARRAKVPPFTRLNQALAAPFRTFKLTVLDMIKIYRHLLLQEKTQNRNPRQTCTFLKSRKNLMFVLPFDVGNNILFVKANCGLNSSARDRAICAEILQTLARSEDMLDFLQSLQGTTCLGDE